MKQLCLNLYQSEPSSSSSLLGMSGAETLASNLRDFPSDVLKARIKDKTRLSLVASHLKNIQFFVLFSREYFFKKISASLHDGKNGTAYCCLLAALWDFYCAFFFTLYPYCYIVQFSISFFYFLKFYWQHD